MKKPQAYWFLHNYITGEVEHHWRKRRAELPPDLDRLVFAACCPGVLSDPNAPDMRHALVTAFAHCPDLTVEIIRYARKRFAWHRATATGKQKTQRAVVRHFLLSHNSAIWKGQRVLLSSLTDEKFAELLSRNRFTITPEVARKERQALATKGTK